MPDALPDEDPESEAPVVVAVLVNQSWMWSASKRGRWRLSTCTHRAAGVCRRCRFRAAVRVARSAAVAPFSWFRWYAPLVGAQWRQQRCWRPDGSCRECGLVRANEGDPDPCLGLLPGVSFACCGHGQRCFAYVAFTDGRVVRGFDRVEK